MKVVIMAGGRGTRISSVASDIPKPMIKIEGKPVLEHEIECLRDQGFKDIILTVSHLGNIIMDYFGDGSGISPVTGKSFGVSIEYYFEKEPLGNAGALFKIKDKLTEDFLLLNADAMFDVDFNRFVEFHKSHGGLVTLFTHPNSHPYDSGLIIANENGIVQKWLAKEDERPLYYKNRVNAGLHVMSPEILKQNIDTPKIDLDRQLLKPLSGTGKIFCYVSPEYVKDMGTPDRYYAVCEDFKAGHVQGKNLKNIAKGNADTSYGLTTAYDFLMYRMLAQEADLTWEIDRQVWVDGDINPEQVFDVVKEIIGIPTEENSTQYLMDRGCSSSALTIYSRGTAVVTGGYPILWVAIFGYIFAIPFLIIDSYLLFLVIRCICEGMEKQRLFLILAGGYLLCQCYTVVISANFSTIGNTIPHIFIILLLILYKKIGKVRIGNHTFRI